MDKATSKIHNHTVMFCLPVTYQGLQLDKQRAEQAHCYVLPGSNTSGSANGQSNKQDTQPHCYVLPASNISGPATGQATSKPSTLLRFAWQ
jgi:hypothetical protein